MLIYIVCYSLLAFLAYQSLYCHSEKRQRKLAIIAYLIVLLVVVMRRDDVGADMISYRRLFQQISGAPMSLSLLMYGSRPGFIIVNWLIGKVTFNFNVFYAILGFITITIIYKVISKLSDKTAVGLFVYVALGGLSATCNTMRAELARALVFLAATYLNERKYKRAVLLFAIAVTIHPTAIIGLLYLFVLLPKKHFKSTIAVLAVAFLLVDIFGIPFLVALYKSADDYSNAIVQGEGFNLFLLVLVSLILIRYTVPFATNGLDKLRASFRICIIGETVQILAFGLSILNRFTRFFWIFFCVLLPEALTRARGSNKYILMFGVFLFLTFWYALSLWNDLSAIVPYHFFWE